MTQELWQKLTTVALIGSERYFPKLPPTESLVGKVLGQVASGDSESNLLGSAATASLYQQIGTLPPVNNLLLPNKAPREEKSRCSEAAASYLAKMLSGEYPQVLPEWLKTLEKLNQRVPEELLPNLLEYSQKHGFQNLIKPVLGERGHWLATQNSNWEFAIKITDFEKSWEMGSFQIRLQTLIQLRAIYPNKARELLERTWTEETPKECKVFLWNLSNNLSMADEPFLESALDDKRWEVHNGAIGLLAKLPESRFMQRMIERVKPLLIWKNDESYEKAYIHINFTDMPDKCNKAMMRDGISRFYRYSTTDKKNWWLQQMLEFIPPKFWLDYWNITSDNFVLSISKNSDTDKLLLDAIISATIRHSDVVLADAILRLALKNISNSSILGLARFLSYEQLENILINLLKTNEYFTYPFITNLIDNRWSKELSRAFLLYIYTYTLAYKPSNNSTINVLLTQAACSMPFKLLKEAVEMWPIETKIWNYKSHTTKQFMALLQFRADMLSALGK